LMEQIKILAFTSIIKNTKWPIHFSFSPIPLHNPRANSCSCPLQKNYILRANTFMSQLNAQILHILSKTQVQIHMLSSKNWSPSGIRTWFLMQMTTVQPPSGLLLFIFYWIIPEPSKENLYFELSWLEPNAMKNGQKFIKNKDGSRWLTRFRSRGKISPFFRNHFFICCETSLRRSRVARWFVFKPKIPIWVKFGIENIVTVYGHLEYVYYGHLV
jgi:hypothetical protein